MFLPDTATPRSARQFIQHHAAVGDEARALEGIEELAGGIDAQQVKDGGSEVGGPDGA